jgi:AcrR family transcriptional regulator
MRVRAGVCFDPPEPLPRGRHDLPRTHVLAAQAERLMIAVTELLAAHGYSGIGIREITARAAVSRGAFYECFSSKEACAFAAYRRFVETQMQRFTALLRPGDCSLEHSIEALLEAYLGLMEDDPVCARAFLVEFDALGREARDERRIALRRMADFIEAAENGVRTKHGQPQLHRPLVAYAGIVYACRATVVDMLDHEPEPTFRDVLPEMTAWAVTTLK